ncbi:MAG: hypothetical protein ACJ72U_02195 [Nitrososphaeraceae archaeon]
MSRTIPSFRIGSVEEQKEWKSFHQALDKSDRKTFGNMFSIVHSIIQLVLLLLNI